MISPAVGIRTEMMIICVMWMCGADIELSVGVAVDNAVAGFGDIPLIKLV